MSPTLSFVVYTFGAFGLTWAIGHSALTLPLRDAWARMVTRRGKKYSWLLTLLECPACLGFWIGFGYAFTSGSSLRDAVELGFYTAAVNFILGRLTGIIPPPLEPPPLAPPEEKP